MSKINKSKYDVNIFSELNRSKHYWFMMLPFLLLFVVFTVLPIIMSWAVSFTEYDMLNPIKWVWFDNYKRIFLDDDIFVTALKNTLILAVITGPISYIICFLTAWLINELGPKLRTVLTVCFYAPVLSGNAYTMWLLVFSPDRYGILNSILLRFKIIDQTINWTVDSRYMLVLVIIVQFWLSLGTGFLSFIAGLQNADRSLFEAGAVDGIKNRFQELWFITLPQMKPQLLFGAVMQIVSAFSVGAVSMSLIGFPTTEYGADTILTRILYTGTTQFEMGYASAMSSVLVLMMLFSNKFIKKLLDRVGS